MTSHLPPRILWPAPAIPAFLRENHRRIQILVEYDGRIDELVSWASDLRLQTIGAADRLQGEIVGVRPLVARQVSAPVSQYLQATPRRHPLFEIELHFATLPSLRRPRRTQSFHLLHRDHVVRANAVALVAERGESLRLAFATDLHISHAWEAIASAVDRHAPDLSPHFCHPQHLLRRFIDEANRLAARGELDLVVLGGDLVDHVFQQPVHDTSANPAESNVQLLLDLLAPLTVPLLAIPGNHDYRVNPWRPRSYGLGSVGIPGARMKEFLKQADLWDRWPLRPSDFRALDTENADGSDGLLTHLQMVAPATDFHVDLHGVRLVFFATGRDLLQRWESLDWSRRGLLTRSLATSWIDPDSEGLTTSQCTWLGETLGDSKQTLLFFHAPILNPHPRRPVEHYIDHIDPGDEDHPHAHVSFERRLHASDIRRGVLAKNVAPLIRMLASHRGSLGTFSGHVHRSSRIDVERRTLAVRSMPMDQAAGREDCISLHIGASLGHVRKAGAEPPGYLLAEWCDGRLQSVQRRTLMAE